MAQAPLQIPHRQLLMHRCVIDDSEETDWLAKITLIPFSRQPSWRISVLAYRTHAIWSTHRFIYESRDANTAVCESVTFNPICKVPRSQMIFYRAPPIAIKSNSKSDPKIQQLMLMHKPNFNVQYSIELFDFGCGDPLSLVIFLLRSESDSDI